MKKYVRKFNEGTWAVPKNDQEYKKAVKIIEKAKDDLYGITGDDILFDYLDNAIKRIDEVWKETKKQSKNK